MDNRLGEHERAILGFFVVIEIDGAEVDAGATLERCEEGGGDVSAYPIGHPIQLLA